MREPACGPKAFLKPDDSARAGYFYILAAFSSLTSIGADLALKYRSQFCCFQFSLNCVAVEPLLSKCSINFCETCVLSWSDVCSDLLNQVTVYIQSSDWAHQSARGVAVPGFKDPLFAYVAPMYLAA